MIEVLIVEDDIRIVDINRRLVEKVAGFRVVATATNGAEAKEMLELAAPQLVLLDVFLPDMLGIDLIPYIREHHPQTDIIMITAAKEIELVQKSLRGGVFDYLMKPLVFERFQERLENYRNHLTFITETRLVDQQEVDLLITRHKQPHKAKESQMTKGIDALTLEKVWQVVGQSKDEGRTSEEVGKCIGASRTTARRYLEYLTEQGRVSADLVYGTVGRPERRYVVKGIK